MLESSLEAQASATSSNCHSGILGALNPPLRGGPVGCLRVTPSSTTFITTVSRQSELHISYSVNYPVILSAATFLFPANRAGSSAYLRKTRDSDVKHFRDQTRLAVDIVPESKTLLPQWPCLPDGDRSESTVDTRSSRSFPRTGLGLRYRIRSPLQNRCGSAQGLKPSRSNNLNIFHLSSFTHETSIA